MACRVLRKVVRKGGAGKTMADVPLVVNAALALELYLKSLATLQYAKTPWGHNLEELFNSLKDSTKRRLIREHKRWEKDPIFDRFRKMGKSPDLLTLLHTGKETFDDW